MLGRRLGACVRSGQGGARFFRSVARAVGSPALAFRAMTRCNELEPDSVATFEEWWADPSSHAKVRNGLLRAVLEQVDAELQGIYRSHLAASPLPKYACAESVLDALQSTGGRAKGVVSQYDWRWLSRWLSPMDAQAVHRNLTRLSNLAFPVQRVNFRFTHHCNISCRHCYNSSGPTVRQPRLDLDAMLDLVRQMPESGIDALNISGGEPFLYVDTVTALVRAGRAARLQEISVYTNSFWAVDREATDRVLDELAESGFMSAPGDHIKASTGTYHQEFINLDRVLLLAHRYFHIFGRKLLIDFAGEVGGSAEAVLRQQLRSEGLGDRVNIHVRGVAPMGRGRDLSVPPRDVNSPCAAINQLTFDPDGRVRPCCGLNSENSGVVIGTMARHRLRRLVKRMQNDSVLHVLASEPMNQLPRSVGLDATDQDFGGACGLCQHAIGGVADRQELEHRLRRDHAWYPFWFVTSDEGSTIDAVFEPVEE